MNQASMRQEYYSLAKRQRRRQLFQFYRVELHLLTFDASSFSLHVRYGRMIRYAWMCFRCRLF